MEVLKVNRLDEAWLLLEFYCFYRAQSSGSLWATHKHTHTIRPPPRCLTALHQTQAGLLLFVSIETAVCGKVQRKRWSEKEEQRQTGNNSCCERKHCDITHTLY